MWFLTCVVWVGLRGVWVYGCLAYFVFGCFIVWTVISLALLLCCVWWLWFLICVWFGLLFTYSLPEGSGYLLALRCGFWVWGLFV